MEKLAIICLTILAVLTMPTVIGTLMSIYYIYRITTRFDWDMEEQISEEQGG